MPVIRIRNVGTDETGTYFDGEFDPVFKVQPGSLLVGMDGDFRIARWHGPVALLNQRVCRLRVDESQCLSTFVELCLQGYLDAIWEETSSVTVKHLSSKSVKEVPLPVPPLAEQERIVEVLEAQLSRLDAALEHVHTVRDKAAQFRRSLLHAAFTGALTGHDTSTGQLPEGWLLRPVGGLPLDLFVDGDWVESKDQDPDGSVRLTQLADVGEGWFRDRSDRWLRTDQAERLGVTRLQKGDLLVARMPDPLGRCCMVPDLPQEAVTVVDVAILRFSEQAIVPSFVMWMLNSPEIRSRMAELASGTTRKRISRTNLASDELPVPPLGEQERIVEVLEAQLSRLDAALVVAGEVEERALALRRSLLHSAFTGKLTEKWREENDV